MENGYTVVLGSGGARGIAHIGAIRYLEENHIPVKAVVGCSIGAELGAFWASGVDVEDLESAVLSLSWRDSLKIFMPHRLRGGFSSGSHAEAFFDRYLGGKNIEEFPIPFAAATTDYYSGELVMLNHGHATTAVRASVAMPGMLTPIRHQGRLLMDGAAASPLPLVWAKAHYGGEMIAINIQDSTAPEKLPGPLGVFRHANCLMQSRLVKMELLATNPEILVEPVVRGISTIKFHEAKHLIEEGYRSTKAVFEQRK